MEIILSNTPEELGKKAAQQTAKLLKEAIAEKGNARLILSTGASQFTTIEALLTQEVDWSCVEMFHLDEYIGIDVTHPASFIKYLQERFVQKINLKKVHFVDTAKGAEAIIEALTAELEKAPVDVGLIGIGENAHIAFNDPPADFTTKAAFKVVTLDEACRNQQLGEGWFDSLQAVPTQAISMTVHQIMQCRHIISAVPYGVKAKAVQATVQAKQTTNQIPATILKEHSSFTLYLDKDSSALL